MMGRVRGLSSSLLAIAGLAGCSPSTAAGPHGGPGAGGNPGLPSFGGGAGTPSTVPTGGPNGGAPDFTAPEMMRGTGHDGPDGSCALATAAAEQVTVEKQVPITVEVTSRTPVALYFMQDQSGSMLEPVLPPTKWNQTMDAITAFVNDKSSEGIDVAIQYFALPTPACDGSGYDVPEVPLAPLPGNAQAIINSLAAKFPLTGTPIEPALRGVTKFCSDYNDKNTDKQCVAVLITDGQPSACNGDQAALAQIAADALAQHKVITFTIGMDGADFTMLSAIAKAGGSDCTPATKDAGDEACNVAGGGTSFIDALNTIRATVTKTETHYETKTEVHSSKLACEFKLPAPPDGQKFDPNKVNVQFTSDAGTEKIYKVASPADCAATQTKGWYYDDPQAPTKILACPNTCSLLQAASGDGGVTTSATAPRVDVILGCKSEPPPA